MPGVYVNSPSPSVPPPQGGREEGLAPPPLRGRVEPGFGGACASPAERLPDETGSAPCKGWGEGDGRKLPAAAKIAAIGLRVANHATYHGLSLNIDMDLEPFSRINPCGHAGLAVTQMQDFGVDFGNKDKMQIIGDKLSTHLSQQLYGMHHG